MLRVLSEREHRARRINNRFGEGASPRLRQVREGLEVLGIKSNEVLHHATPRLLYACALGADARARLLGVAKAEASLTSRLENIAEAWRRRWLLPRIRRPEVLQRLASLGPAAIRLDLLLPAYADEPYQMALAI